MLRPRENDTLINPGLPISRRGPRSRTHPRLRPHLPSRGQRDGRQTPRGLRVKGFTGNYATVLRYLNRLQDAQQGAAPYRPRARSGPPLVTTPKQVLTPRTAAWTILRPPDRRGSEEKALLARLDETAPILETAATLVEEFVALVRGRKPERLTPGYNGRRTARCRHYSGSPSSCRRTRPARRGGAGPEQRAGRGRDQQAENPQASDVRPGQP